MSPGEVGPRGRSMHLTIGIAAYNEERRIGGAIRALLAQALPPGVRVDEVLVVASGCTDRTTAVVRGLAAEDPRIRLIEETVRLGKSSALGEIFAQATGDALLLMNGDARPEPGAVAALITEAAKAASGPVAVMARPVPPQEPGNLLTVGLAVLWGVHHRFHARTLADGHGTHLSDELLLLEGRPRPPMGPGIINDGAFLGAWLREHGGTLLYAPGARVTLSVPATFREHVRQRRRIHSGHQQVVRLTGVAPSTLQRLALTHPVVAARMVLAETREHRRGIRALALLVAAETIALAAAAWDRLPPKREPIVWRPIDGTEFADPSERGSFQNRVVDESSDPGSVP